MSRKVLIISSTPRKDGNSDILCDAFADGAKEAGNEVKKVRIADLKIGYCTDCYACQKSLLLLRPVFQVQISLLRFFETGLIE